MTICPRCKFKYKNDAIVQPLFTNDKNGTRYLCPICALDEIRKIHENSNYEFRDGSIANKLLLEAMKERTDAKWTG